MLLLAISTAFLPTIIRRFEAALLPREKREPEWRLSTYEKANPPVTVFDQSHEAWFFYKTTLWGMRHEAEISPKPAQGLYKPVEYTEMPARQDTVYVFYDMGCAVAVLGYEQERDRMESFATSFYAPRTLMRKLRIPCYVWHCTPPMSSVFDGSYTPATEYLERHVALRLLADLDGTAWKFDVINDHGDRLGYMMAEREGLGHLPRHVVSARMTAASVFARHGETGFYFFGRKEMRDLESTARKVELGRVVDGHRISLRVMPTHVSPSRLPAVIDMLESKLTDTDLDLPYRWPAEFIELNSVFPVDIAVSRVSESLTPPGT